MFRTGEEEPIVNRGHGTGALGPSDSTDSGSDITGGPGLNHQEGIGLDRGTTSDVDEDGPGADAGADIGDADLDSDSDRTGTGERGAVGRDGTLPNDEVLREESFRLYPGDQNPHDFARRDHAGRQTLEALDLPADEVADAPDEDLDTLDGEQEAPDGGQQPGLISGGIGGPSGTGGLGGKTGPGSGRNPGKR
ncbi:MAG: hypothetical protein ABI920_00005 [Casimicrobiaceae bacterium]